MGRAIRNIPFLYVIICGILWILWQIFIDDLLDFVRSKIPEGGVLIYILEHPNIIMPLLLVIISCVVIYVRHKKLYLQNPRAYDKTADDKLSIVAKAIIESRKSTPINEVIHVYITEETGLAIFRYRELVNALLTLQDDKKVIRLISFPFWFHKGSTLPNGWSRTKNKIISSRNQTYILDGRGFVTNFDSKTMEDKIFSNSHFAVSTLNNFDKWFEKNVN